VDGGRAGAIKYKAEVWIDMIINHLRTDQMLARENASFKQMKDIYPARQSFKIM
jgi:hypothetical protein